MCADSVEEAEKRLAESPPGVLQYPLTLSLPSGAFATHQRGVNAPCEDLPLARSISRVGRKDEFPVTRWAANYPPTHPPSIRCAELVSDRTSVVFDFFPWCELVSHLVPP
jgi:hypothetical protein